MITTCSDCGASYDDADRNTICPHPLIMPADDLARKKSALALMDRDICFASQPTGPVHRVQSVSWDGMVTITGHGGQFAPHLFVPHVKDAKVRPHLIDGEFQSDKYPVTPRGFVPLKVTDKAAQPLLWAYAQAHRAIDREFSDDLEQALILAGFAPKGAE